MDPAGCDASSGILPDRLGFQQEPDGSGGSAAHEFPAFGSRWLSRSLHVPRQAAHGIPGLPGTTGRPLVGQRLCRGNAHPAGSGSRLPSHRADRSHRQLAIACVRRFHLARRQNRDRLRPHPHAHRFHPAHRRGRKCGIAHVQSASGLLHPAAVFPREHGGHHQRDAPHALGGWFRRMAQWNTAQSAKSGGHQFACQSALQSDGDGRARGYRCRHPPGHRHHRATLPAH